MTDPLFPYSEAVRRAMGALEVEHETQRLMLERLGIEWTPGEPFYSLVEAEITRLRNAGLDLAARLAESEVENDQWQKKLADTWAKTVPLEDVRKLWKAWKQAWGTGDSEEAYALMEMDQLLGVDEKGDPL